ncbi:MAG: RAMP superfamily CRISPR-associated protein [Saprospiraceae bacterium]|nr:hypothetical protein [Lewinella sp.]
MDKLQYGSLNTVTDLQLEVLSPVHVGTAGEKLLIENMDFVYRDGQVVLFDKKRMLQLLAGAYTGNNRPALKAYQQLMAAGKLWELEGFLEDCSIDLEEITAKEHPLRVAPANEIRPLIRTGRGRPIIPGSSIKGAIRSVLFHHLFEMHGVEDRRKADRELFGDIGNNIMSYIRPYDVEVAVDQVGMINIDLFNLYEAYGDWESDYKEQFFLSVEAFLPGAGGKLRLTVADGLLEKLQKEESQLRHANRLPKPLTPKFVNDVISTANPIDRLFELINRYTRTHITREIEFFTRFQQAADTEFTIQNLEKFQALTHDADACVLRLAYGSGFHAITGDYRFPDHTSTIYRPDQLNQTWDRSTRSRRPARYKSRKITGSDLDTTALGYVKLSKSQ